MFFIYRNGIFSVKVVKVIIMDRNSLCMMTMLSLLFVLMWSGIEGALASQGEQIYSPVILDKMITWSNFTLISANCFRYN